MRCGCERWRCRFQLVIGRRQASSFLSVDGPAFKSGNFFLHLIDGLPEGPYRPFMSTTILVPPKFQVCKAFFKQLELGPCDFQFTLTFDAHSTTSIMPFTLACLSVA